MAPTRRTVLAAIATTGALAGCAGSPGSNGGSTPTETADGMNPTDTPTDQPTTGSPTTTGGSATVQVFDHPDHGEILTGPDRMTLYMFDNDTQGQGSSTCYDSCASAWPPLTVEGTPTPGDGVTASLTTFAREDGSMQVAANGWPLYYYSPDEQPGDATGQGVGGVWWVLSPGGEPKRPESTGTPTGTTSGYNPY